ncbi:tRNA (guanine-N(1)-)-methyltransferase [Fundidesulfovibrio magnetotacticus]|uniref:tRNA (guanine-N(1)-)-methyltransferase n=1 Tax=Fundidesulfovibrio magnetotacticus TaxID=2730080 RepID=A0A6V8LXW0_9BACT|nr:tRNA (guanosine(37)-N1)-methyltransferase TrmD [Fundidesulfovibrio magnetotacticus]GFK94889.1 tRNA (guanine-N(1)-)-methyltransferase [Fundidesulfovibrio magnetotacticus]
MRFNLLTLFPEFFESPLSCALMGKAREQGVVDFNLVNPRDFAFNKHRSVDDRPYGGGPGMVMALDPLAHALRSLENPGRILLMSPRGRPLTQALARELAAAPAVTILCGRYEGIDERLLDLFPVELVSAGDFVLSGGESAAMCLVEAVARLVPGFMGKEESGEEESFSAGLLEYPQYTRPEVYEGLGVPDVLLGGDHARVAALRREQSLGQTLARRPDLLGEAPLTGPDRRFLAQKPRTLLGRALYVALVHGPVLNKKGHTVTVSLTNLDLHDIARISRTYGLAGFFAVTPLEDQQALARTLLDHWTLGAGGRANPDRAEALGKVRVAATLEEAVSQAREHAGQDPWVLATSARPDGGVTPGAVRETLRERPVLLALGTGSGLAPEALALTHGQLAPVRPFGAYNHLPVRAAFAILADRILGDIF